MKNFDNMRNHQGIGVSKEHKLDGSERASYNALALGTVEYKVERNEDITGIQAPYAYMRMELQQESSSMVEITEVDPLDMAEILGQVGGFWDLLLIFWPICFVAASQEAPHLKPRNFWKSAVRAKEKVGIVGTAVDENVSVESKTRDPSRTTFRGKQEQFPTWERRGSASRYQKGKEVRIRLFEDHGLVAVTKASSRLATFLQAEFGVSYLRRGAVEPSLKKLLPAKTLLVIVPPNATALSLATRIEKHCMKCSKQTSSELVVVKVTRVSCSMRQSQALEASRYLSAGDDVNECVVESREEWVGRRFAPAYSSGEGSSQPGTTRSAFQRISTFFQWSNTPEAISLPARRPPSVDVGKIIPGATSPLALA